MTFIGLMALREIRASWRRLLFFFICVAIGVGAIVALRSLIQTVRTELAHQARALIAGDVSIRTDRPWTPDVRATLERRLAAAPVVARQEMIETATMVRPEQGKGAAVARIVELRGVEPGFPFYGSLTLADGRPFSHDQLANRGALVRPELLAQLGLSVGDRLMIGGKPFTIRGVIAQEPGRRAGAFSLGSRVLVDLTDLKQTGLLSFGSRAGYYVLLKVQPQGVAPLVKQLREDFRDRYVSVWSYQSTEDQIGEDLQRAENDLSLVGFVILILGGIGVWSVTRVFVRQQIRSVAILKCVGATTGQVLAAYVLQVLLLGSAGSALGIVLARIGLSALPASFAVALGVDGYHLTASAVWQGVGVGLLVSLLFSLVPLLEVRRVKPLLLLRAATPARRFDWLQVAAGAVVAASLVAIASWQAASLKLGAIVCGGFAGIGVVLYIAGTAVVRAVRPLAAARAFPLRHAVLSLARPGNQTRVILLAVGLGSFFVVGVRSVQSTLVQEFSIELSTSGADMFLIEILPTQVEEVRQFLVARKAPGSPPARLIPVLRARVTGVRGRDTNLSSFEDVRRQGAMGREFVITYRDRLEPNEKVVEGTFWTGQAPLPEDARPAEVSVERGLMQRAHLRLGDVLRFDVLGRVVDARVTSVRDVQWRDARNGGFMFVFRPGTFAHAPQTYIAILQAPPDPSDRGRFQRDLTARFPNVSAIDVREILTTIATAIGNVTLAISIVGGVALMSGILILVGVVAMTKFQRVYEAAILRTLGASTRMLAVMLALEYGGLGLLAGAIGGLGAIALSWAVARYVLDLTWHPAPGIAAAGALATTALVGIVGVAASYDVLRRKPLATLRAE
jgi:putative ABC transport system permease protein